MEIMISFALRSGILWNLNLKNIGQFLKLTYVLQDIILKSSSHFIVLMEDAESPSFH